MNQCNSHGTCNQVTGQCECSSGWKFADCSVSVVDMNQATSTALSTNGPSWSTLQYSGSKSSKMKIASDSTSNIDIYVSKGTSSDPNNFVFDMNMLDVNGTVTIDSNELGLGTDSGYSVAIYINAINETSN